MPILSTAITPINTLLCGYGISSPLMLQCSHALPFAGTLYVYFFYLASTFSHVLTSHDRGEYYCHINKKEVFNKTLKYNA